jgi:hydroxymethylpyrimidine/phosphomethylpyrimidine kinase
MTRVKEGDNRVPAALSIAGSDSGGGAGIQADLKAFARCGVHGMTAITAITAQNTVGVEAVEAIPPEIIEAQVSAVADDIGVDAVKVGRLGSRATIEAVARSIEGLGGPSAVPVVVDPVMVAESGAELLDPEARETLISILLPLATVVTPNIPEARSLTGLAGDADQEALASAIREFGPEWVVVTGGHSDRMVDLLVGPNGPIEIEGDRHEVDASHGSGCTHSSALAAGLALGMDVPDAARLARSVASAAVGRGLVSIGAGSGPVDALGIGPIPNA